MASMQTITCACGCRQTRQVRTADVKRGWGKYINKQHKARHQEQRTGQYAAYKRMRQNGFDCGEVSMESGFFGHGQE